MIFSICFHLAAVKGRVTALQAMRHWQKRTCIKFETKKAHHQDYVTFMHHSIGCVHVHVHACMCESERW